MTSSAARTAALLYGVFCYLVFLVVLLYAIAFVGNFWTVLGWNSAWMHGMDRGRSASLGEALAVDAALLGLFAVQHSVMARGWFKRGWTRIIPSAIERSTFVLAASLCLALLFWQWRPIGSVVWSVGGLFATLLVVVSLTGWLIVAASTYMIDHFDLFGLRQVFDAFRGRAPAEGKFATPAFYRLVRHPIYFGFIVAFWATPVMTVGHLVFAAATTGYILVAIQLEERDLIARYGDTYRDYRRRVAMLVPRGRRSGAQPHASDGAPRVRETG
jgi:methanethiol S-methyltransferase